MQSLGLGPGSGRETGKPQDQGNKLPAASGGPGHWEGPPDTQHHDRPLWGASAGAVRTGPPRDTDLGLDTGSHVTQK